MINCPMGNQTDPVHKENGKWYFWYETWADKDGPYDSEPEARTALKYYCEHVLGD